MSTLSTSELHALSRFRAALAQRFGARLERAVLFGSRARGDARPDSDFDVTVFLRQLNDRWQDMDHLADLATDILYEEGTVVHPLVYAAGAYAERTPLMHEIRRDGIDL